MIEVTARLVAAGSDWSKARFSYQEYYERMDKQVEAFWLTGLCSAYSEAQVMGLPSIGGKDSMKELLKIEPYHHYGSTQ